MEAAKTLQINVSKLGSELINTINYMQICYEYNNMIGSLKKSKGGRQLQQKIDNFKESTYDLKLSYSSRKRKAQEALVFEKGKCQKLERELEKVKKENENLNKLNKHFARKLVKKACGHVNLKRSGAGKNLNEYS